MSLTPDVDSKYQPLYSELECDDCGDSGNVEEIVTRLSVIIATTVLYTLHA